MNKLGNLSILVASRRSHFSTHFIRSLESNTRHEKECHEHEFIQPQQQQCR